MNPQSDFARAATWTASAGHRRSLTPPYTAQFDQLSLSCCFVELIHEGKKFGTASGFFWRHEQSIYLATNWHVVTGKHAFTGAFIAQGQCPDRLRVHFNYRTRPTAEQISLLGPDAKTSDQGQVELYAHRDYHQPLWLQHPLCLTEGIDIILLRFNPTEIGIDPKEIICLNDYGFSNLHNFVGSDVLVIGYPIDEDALKFPVWKKGGIASELLLPWKNKPAFLIDCRTSSGMSGSPVIRRVFGPSTDHNMTTNLNTVVTSEFLGIYSGRLHDNENLASIGLVWWRTMLDEIASYQHAGDRG